MTTEDNTNGGEPECDRYNCERTPERTFIGFDGQERSWCKECYERNCGQCKNPFQKDANRAKGLCQDCQDKIASWSESDDAQDADNDSDIEAAGVQTTLMEIL